MKLPAIDHPKPPLPYQPGQRFTVRTHASSQALISCAAHEFENLNDRLSPDRSHSHQGQIGEESIELQIQKLLQTGNDERAQVFTVTLCGPNALKKYDEWKLSVHTPLVAKLFDPVYFNDDDEDGCLDPFKRMDQFYTHEALAYQKLAVLQGQLIPRCYGSYSLNLSLKPPDSGHREIRLILMQYVEGDPMSNLRPSQFSQSFRQDILRTIMNLESRIYARDITLTDLAPRNIILAPEKKRRVFFLDFGEASFQHERPAPAKAILAFPKFSEESDRKSTLQRWKNNLFELDEWVDWDWNSWLKSEFGDTG